MARKKATSRKRPAAKKARAAGKKRTAKKKVTAKRAAPSRKKAAKKAAGKGRKSKTVSKKTAAKKPSAKKTKKKAAGKKTTTKKAVSRKATPKKAAKKAAKKKVAKKPAAKKKVTAKAAKTTTASKAKAKRKAVARAVPRKPTGKIAVAAKAPANRKPTAKRRRRTTVDSDALIHGITPYRAASGEEYMSDAQLDHFREILLAWKRELMEEVDRTVHHMQDEASNFPDPNDRATQESEFGLELRTRDRERKLLKKIDSALQRIDDGSYGFCEETGEEIGLKRLEARPVATLCVEAQERRELAERQYRDRDDQYR
jgi:DnaK suppressor protein